jgi:type I restriction enzyme, S subunit
VLLASIIAKKQALLERLAEKRQAVITQAVTKGLNPAAPMKPSGIDWLGDIPAHWGVVPLKWQCTIRSGQVDPTEAPYDEMMLVAPDHIESGTGRLLARQTASEQAAISGKYLCSPSDVLYSKIRPALRKVALVDEVCLCSADMYAIAPGENFERESLYYFLLTDAFTAYAELASMRVAMPKINREALGPFQLPKPPEEEQKQIVATVRASLMRLDGVVSSALKSIEHMAEYRSALITAAVTGQIEGLR